VAETDDKYELDFTSFFDRKAVQAETIPAADRLAIDPEFRIGAAKLETEGYFVALARRAAAPAVPSGDCKVMVVEDDPVTNAVLLKVLANDGFKAFGAFDAAGFGKLLKEHGLPQLILLDVELPKVSGLQILARIRKHPSMSAIPALILTSRASMTDVARGMALGADGYLSKPASVENLRMVLRQLLGALPRKG
jgi:CheY-like chemotaxis protein